MKKPLLIFDLESTSAEIATAKIVEIAMLKVFPDGNRESFQTLINPGCKITNSDIHHITDLMVSSYKKFDGYAEEIRDFMDNCDLSGYNIKRFDIPLLAEEFARVNIPWGLAGRKVIDPFILYKLLHSQSLAAAYMKYTGKEIDGAHRAMADVEASYDVLQGMIAEGRLPLDPGMGTEQVKEALIKFQNNGEDFDPTVDFAGKFIRTKDKGIVFAFGKYKGQSINTDHSFLTWMLKNDFTMDTKKWCRAFINSEELPF